MENEETNTGTEATEDTSKTGEATEGTVTDETGSVTPDEIAAALGPKYKTAVPAKEETNPEGKEDKDAVDKDKEDTEQETETEEKVAPKPAKEVEQEVATDPNVPDFSLTVEDAEGTSYKINGIEDLPEDFTPKNNRQIIQILQDLSKAENDKVKYEADQQTEVANAEKAERITTIQKGWDEEIKSLKADKRLNDERVGQVYKFMADENSKRIAANKPTIGSFEDALDKLDMLDSRKAKVEADKAEKETARKNGALVGGGSAMSTSTTPVYKAGSARNVNQALRAQGLI